VVVVRLWLVRHGATDWSDEGRLCGWTDVPLSEKGRGQAKILRRRLEGQGFDGVWTSDLSRASESARLAVGRPHPDRGLRELDFGELEGRRWRDCDEPTREALVRFEGFVAPGGESVRDLEERVGGFLSELTTGDHLVFTHGGVVRLLTRQQGDASILAPGELAVLEWGRTGAEWLS
jgi:probable phosphoglycerate mutase